MSKSVAVGLVLLTVFLPVAVAAGKSTVDPNASGSSGLSGVEMGQKVTYEAKRKTLLLILSDLGKMTGVTLKAGRNSEDWQVRDRKMNIFAKDMPLAELMSSIARVGKLKWSKSGSGEAVSYRLYMDDKTRRAVESRQMAEDERVRKRLTEKRKNLLSELEKASAMSDADLEKLKTESPYICSIAGEGRPERVFPKLFKEMPSAKQSFLNGEDLAVDFDTLSEDVKKGLWGGFKPGESSGQLKIIGGNKPGGVLASVTISYADDPEHKGIASRQQSVSFALADPDSAAVNVCASMNSTNTIDADKAVQLSKLAQQERLAATKDVGEPLIEHPDDAALHVKVKIKQDGDAFADALAALSKASGFSVVSDGFERKMWGLSFPAEETELRAVLSQLESTYCRYNWERHGSTLELQDRDWYKKLAIMIPEASIEKWRNAFIKDGLLDLGELSQIAQLTPEQVSANLAQDDILSQAYLSGVGGSMDNRDLLSAYAGLERQQQALIFTKQGLSFDSMAGSQSPAVQALWHRCSAPKSGSGAELGLTGRREVKDGRNYYFFDVIKRSGGFVGLRWIVRCPSYKPPIAKAAAAR